MAKMTCNFISYTLKRAVDITVVIPSATIPESMGLGDKPTHVHKPYPVLYLLHGYGNNHATWTGYSNVELFAEERRIAVVMLSAENKAYINHGGDDDYFTFVSEELPSFIQNTFPISKRREDTYICGLSMGGYGATVHGLSKPENFKAIGTLSGAVGGMGNDGPKPADLLKKLVEEKKDIPDIYLACGNKDFILDSNHEFDNLMKELNVKHTSEFVDGYGHEWRFWNLEVERFLDWIDRTDDYAGKKRTV